MHERSRMAYLQSLGIHQFVPKVQLLHAPASKLCICSEPLVAPAVQSADCDGEQQVPQPADALAGKVLDSLRSDAEWGNDTNALVEDAEAGAVVQDHVSTVVSLQSGQSEETSQPREMAPPQASPRFCLAVWRTSTSVMIIDSHRPELALPTEVLLRNMLRHSRWATAQLSSCEYQRWPVLGQSSSSTSWNDAKEVLNGFLDGVLASSFVDCLWLMGEDAFRAANGKSVEDEQPFDELCFRDSNLPQHGTRVLVMPSLCDILRQTPLKERLWQLLLSELTG